jgi:hypothetical protein
MLPKRLMDTGASIIEVEFAINCLYSHKLSWTKKQTLLELNCNFALSEFHKTFNGQRSERYRSEGLAAHNSVFMQCWRQNIFSTIYLYFGCGCLQAEVTRRPALHKHFSVIAPPLKVMHRAKLNAGFLPLPHNDQR